MAQQHVDRFRAKAAIEQKEYEQNTQEHEL